MEGGLEQSSGLRQGEVAILPCHFPQDRDANSPEPVPLAILARPSLEESLQDHCLA